MVYIVHDANKIKFHNFVQNVISNVCFHSNRSIATLQNLAFYFLK